MSVTIGSQGLEVSTGDGGYRKLRAAQQGLYYWDKECQQVILNYLDEFLPHVSEYPDVTNGRGVFQKVVDGVEVCANSTALARNRLPRTLVQELEAAVARLRQSISTPGITPEAKLLIEKFTLPDPARLPEFYRTYRGKSGKRLLVLWGCENSNLDSIAPEAAIKKLRRENAVLAFLRRTKWVWLACALFALLFLVASIVLAWPRAWLQVSKQTIQPSDVVRARFAGSRGNFFDFEAPGGTLAGKSNDLIESHTNGAVRATWKPNAGRDCDPTQFLDLLYGSPGIKDIQLVAHGQLFGFALPDSKAVRQVLVENPPAAPILEEPSPSARPGTHGSSRRLIVDLLTPPGHYPAEISAQAFEAGQIDFAGIYKANCLPGQALKFSDCKRPGRYKITFNPQPNSSDTNPEYVFLRLEPPGGSSPLVANMRLNPTSVKAGKKVLIDTSASYDADPDASITSQEISIDEGKTFRPMKDDYEVISPDSSGRQHITLRLTDSKRRTAVDTQDLIVQKGAPSTPQPFPQRPGESPKEPTTYIAPDSVLFETGSAELSDKGSRILERFAAAVKSQPYVIQIIGHTDDRPISISYPDNLALSEARAKKAAEFLESNAGIAADHIKAFGMGESEPILPNTTESNRAKNRRIEITVLPVDNQQQND